MFRKDAYEADWSKADNRIAFNAKASDDLYHVYTIKPDGTDVEQLGIRTDSLGSG